MSKNKNKLKALFEQRNNKLIELDSLTKKAMEEERAFTDDEKTKFESLENEVRALSDTIEKCRRDYENDIKNEPDEKRADEKAQEEAEIRAFEDFIRRKEMSPETRADSNWTVGDNGAVIPSRIANKIIEEVKDRCNIFSYATKYNLGGTLNFPVYDESTGKIAMTYAEEFKTLSSTSAEFKTVTLKGYLAASKTKVSRSLINNSQFNLFPYVLGKVGETTADWVEGELLKGTEGKIEGLGSIAASVTTLSADGLIELQDSVKQAFQKNCRFIMSPATKSKIRKFKDGQGNYLLERDYSKGNGQWTLLGKPVEITDAMADDDIFYGDFSGLYVKIAENPEIEILREQYSDEHAVGINVWLELDAKVIEPQKIKRLTVASA